MSKHLIFAACLLLLPGAVYARDITSLPEPVNVRDLQTPAPDPAAARADTTYLLGGPGALSGKFQDAQGLPDWQGWTSVDITQLTDIHWSISTDSAANLDTIADNHAWWCGDLFEPCTTNDPPEGVGNNWYQFLNWSGAVTDPARDVTVRVRAVLNLDIEPAYDYLYLQKLTTDDFPTNITDFTGQRTGYQLDETLVVAPSEYLDGDEVRLRFALITDGAFSDEDCLWPTGGGCELDNIVVTFDQGDGEIQIGEVETCEPGSPRQWTPTAPRGVGDFAQVWSLLDDLDPDARNDTPQVAFIDDGVVVPGTGGYPCLSWCYGPGGFIVNPERGIAELHVGIRNEIWSPVLALPPGGVQGALLTFDVYVHGAFGGGSPYMFPTWRVRSSSDPAGLSDWTEWRTYNGGLWGGPTYVRPLFNVVDLLTPGAAHVQIALGVRNYLYYGGLDGTPAPYFDNVAFLVLDDTEPHVLHVRADGAGDYATIQQAIYAAASGDTVLLADGVYSGAGNRDLTYLGKDITIASASGDPSTCVLEGANEYFRAIEMTQIGGPGAVLAGVTVRGFNESSGAAIYLRESGLTIEHCVFDDNIAGGSNGYGGAIYGYDADIIVRDCLFTGNEAERGGAIGVDGESTLQVISSLFTRNKAYEQGAGVFARSNAQVTIDGCTFVLNRDQLNFGIITTWSSGPVEVSRTIVAMSEVGRAVHCQNAGAVTLTCSDLFGNHAGDWTGCVADQLGTAGNISADPLFCLGLDPTDPYTLDTESPCAPAAQPVCGLIGARDTACSVVAAIADEAVPALTTRLFPASPNPFNPRTRIRFELAVRSRVELAVFDLRGRRVRTLVDSGLTAGAHERVWDGHTDQGRTAASGTYVVRLIADGTVASRRITLLK